MYKKVYNYKYSTLGFLCTEKLQKYIQENSYLLTHRVLNVGPVLIRFVKHIHDNSLKQYNFIVCTVGS